MSEGEPLAMESECGAPSGVSEAGRLFRRRAGYGTEPIENYLSELVAIAVAHDDAPMRRALGAVVWPGKKPRDAAMVTGITARTQCYLPPIPGARDGYLDLVLDVNYRNGDARSFWVEVKVDTGEHNNQLDVYCNHALARVTQPAILTLSKVKLRPREGHPVGDDVGWLSWDKLARAIEGTDRRDGRWADLLAFLAEEQVTWPTIPLSLDDPTSHLRVLAEVNHQIALLWPGTGMSWMGPGGLRNQALAEYERSHRLVATAGPLTYGLVAADGEWYWSLAVGSANYQHVHLASASIVETADREGLSNQWMRLGTKFAAVEGRERLTDLATHEGATQWFGRALEELKAANVLREYLSGLAAKPLQTTGDPVLDANRG